jgi:DNA-binding transcriptional LysR family regulator
MDRLTSLRVFREIIETGSFSAAAERLGVSAPMASKHIAQLEDAAGARLLHRSSRRLSPTEAGATYYAQCRQALDILDAADAAIREGAASPRGQLKITAPVWCATPRFAQALADYHQAFPDVVVDVRLENRMVDLVAEGFDLALRAAFEPSPTLFARALCAVQFSLVATPECIARMNASPDETGGLGAIVPTYVSAEKLFPRRPAGKASLHPRIVMRTDDTTLSYFAVLAGIGMAVLPDWTVGDDITTGRLIVLKRDRPTPPITLHAVYTSRSHVTPKLRSFIDFFARRFGPPPGQTPRAAKGAPAKAKSTR